MSRKAKNETVTEQPVTQEPAGRDRDNAERDGTMPGDPPATPARNTGSDSDAPGEQAVLAAVRSRAEMLKCDAGRMQAALAALRAGGEEVTEAQLQALAEAGIPARKMLNLAHRERPSAADAYTELCVELQRVHGKA